MSAAARKGPRFPSVTLVLIMQHLPACHGAMGALTARRLLHRLRHGTVPLNALQEVLIVHHGLCNAEREYLIGAAGIPVQFVAANPDSATLVAVHAARTQHLVFASETQCPAADWLEKQLGELPREVALAA